MAVWDDLRQQQQDQVVSQVIAAHDASVQAGVQSYKDSLQKQTDDATASVQAQYSILKDQFSKASSNNEQVLSNITPQVQTVVKSNKVPYLIAGAIVIYLYIKGKL
jgi:D-serine deaminase-like pyridoxal phosphate-dependent protein